MCPSATEKGKIHYLHEKKKKERKQLSQNGQIRCV